jgi:hypothetical protein
LENLCLRVRYLGDLSEAHRKLPAGHGAKFRDTLLNGGRAAVGSHERLRHIHDDVDFVIVLEPNRRGVGHDVLTLIDEPLGDDAVVRSAQRAVSELKLRFHKAAFEPTNRGLLGALIFLGDVIRGFSLIVVRARDGTGIDES